MCLEAGTRGVGVALQDEAFGLRGLEALVVPAGLCWLCCKLSDSLFGRVVLVLYLRWYGSYHRRGCRC
jgi:hypothetical protein